MTPRRLTVSEILRARRIECGLDVDHVAEILRIRQPVLIAIEDGNFDQLPGPAYAVGFVRAYAAYLGLDAESLVIRFKAEAAEMARRPHLSFPLPIKDSHVPTRPLLIVCILLAAITYGGWYYSSMQPDLFSDMTPVVPERLRRLLTPPAVQPPAAEALVAQGPVSQGPPPTATVASDPSLPPATLLPAPSAVGPSPTVPAAATQSGEGDGVPPVEVRPGQPAVASSGLPALPDLAQPSLNGDAGKNATTIYGVSDADARVVLHANSDSWVQVRDNHANLIFTRVLKAGEHYNVPNQAGLTLIAGNAGGLDISVDGVATPRIGDVGKVVRNVSLDPERLLGSERLLSTPPHAN